MFLYVPSSFAIILMGKRELVALLSLFSWCLVIVERLFLAVPWVSLQFVIMVVPDHTHLRFLHHGEISKAYLPNLSIECDHVLNLYSIRYFYLMTLFSIFRQH